MNLHNLFIIDTNILISYLLFHTSTPGKAVSKALRKGILLFSDESITELMDVLNRKKFDHYVSAQRKKEFLKDLLRIALHVEVKETIQACRDPKDNKFLELAVSGHAHCIITGDKDLLVLNPFRNILILNPTDFLKWEPVFKQNPM